MTSSSVVPGTMVVGTSVECCILLLCSVSRCSWISWPSREQRISGDLQPLSGKCLAWKIDLAGLCQVEGD